MVLIHYTIQVGGLGGFQLENGRKEMGVSDTVFEVVCLEIVKCLVDAPLDVRNELIELDLHGTLNHEHTIFQERVAESF